MRITLSVIAGPHKGQEFTFARHDTFLVGRSRHAHFQLPAKDKYFSRIHFMIEMNPPQCRLVDMGSHNGTYVNGVKVLAADLKDGDQIRAGHTILKLAVHPEGSDVEIPTGGHAAVTVSAAAETQTAPAENGRVPLQPEIPGLTFDRELGRGGMGVVYLATRQADGTRVAVKVIVPAVTGSQGQVERFLTEARQLLDLNHPHIVRFRDLGEHRGVLYFVMDYVDGTDAARLVLSEGQLKIRRALRLANHMLLALEYAHARGVVHRDIKPANLLIGRRDDREYGFLADFGLARVYQESQLSGLTMTGDVAGAGRFLAPEQITNYRIAEPPADQYAAAATLYYLLTGKQVYDLPKEIHRQFSMILQQQPVPIAQRRSDIPPELAAVIHKALSRNPAHRFADVAAFRQALIKAAPAEA